MTAALVQIATTFATLVALGIVWFGLQSVIRRYFPSMGADGEDPFRSRFGCGGCAGGACSTDDRVAAP